MGTTTGTRTAPSGLGTIKPNQVPTGPAPKKTVMPAPANDGRTKNVREVTWPLFNGNPNFRQIKQAPSLANCPVPAILAAHAFTPTGRTTIQGMVSETAASVVTDVSGLPADTLETPPPGNVVASSRFFTVNLPSGAVEVSDVLYTDDADSGWSLIYLTDPSQGSLWGSIIEKALAVHLHDYEQFDASNTTAEGFWQMMTGVQPTILPVDSSTPLSQITNAANASTTVPTIGASKDDLPLNDQVTAFHGYSFIGKEGSKLKLYDPAKADHIVLTPAVFRQKFKAVLFRP